MFSMTRGCEDTSGLLTKNRSDYLECPFLRLTEVLEASRNSHTLLTLCFEIQHRSHMSGLGSDAIGQKFPVG